MKFARIPRLHAARGILKCVGQLNHGRAFVPHAESTLSHDRLERRPEEFRFGDSPWFWVALFGSVAVVALAIVGQKYARRQARIEARWQNRIQTQNERSLRQSGQANSAETVAPAISDQTPQPRASLVPLLLLFSMVAIAGYLGFFISLMRHQRRQAPTAGDS